MAKGTQRKKVKRTFALFNFSILLFSFSVLLYLGGALFLRSYNNSLSSRAQELTQEMSVLGIDISQAAVEQSTRNAELNGLDNVSFEIGRAHV